MGLRIAESVRRTRREHLEHVSSVLAEISIVAAATFSLSRGRWLVPGIGTIKGARDKTQANASCAGVQFSAVASFFSVSTSSRLWRRLSPGNRRFYAGVCD